jgi:hypothetical protein
MKEFLITRKNVNGSLFAEIGFFKDEATAWGWARLIRNSDRPVVFVEEISLGARWTGRHAA